MKRKSGLTLLLVLVLLFGILQTDRTTVYADGTSSGIDVILVMDLSGSMVNTDPNRVSLEGAKLFLDMMESSGSRCGFIAFSDQIVQTYNLSTVSSADDKANIKNAIDTLQYDATGDTDIGLAASQAVNMLTTASDVGNKKMVIFFTDGEIDLPKGTPSEKEAEQASLTQATDAMNLAGSEGIPLYTIGLNANGQVDKNLITSMADSTGGTNHIVTSASELPSIYNDIFASFTKSEIDDLGVVKIQDSNVFEEKTFNIPNASVLEANIVMITNGVGSLNELELISPSGNTIVPDNKNYYLTMSKNYNMLKMIGPEAGDWRLRIKGDKGCEIQLNLLFNYDVELKVTLAPSSSGDGVQINAILVKNGSPITDDALCSQMTTVANITRDDGTTNSYPMNLQNNNYIGDVPVSFNETITITVHTEGANMYRDSEPIEYTNTTGPSLQIGKSLPSPITVKGFIASMAKHKMVLDDYFVLSDPSGHITYSIALDDDSVVDASVNGSELILKGKDKGSTFIMVTARDRNGSQVSQSAIIEVKGVLKNIIPLIIIAVVLLVIILVIVLILSMRPELLDGYISYSISTDGIYFSRENTLFINSFGRKENLSNIVTDPELMSMDIHNIILSGAKGGITVTNNSKNRNIVLKDMFEERKKLTLQNNDTCTVECIGDGSSPAIISIRYTYENTY